MAVLGVGELTHLLMVLLFLLDPNRPWRNNIGLVSLSVLGCGGAWVSHTSSTASCFVDTARRDVDDSSALRVAIPASRKGVADLTIISGDFQPH